MTQTTSQTKDLVDKAFDIPEIRITDEYWINTNKLKPWLNIEDNGWWNVKTIIFTRLATVWTWNQSFTWFWFTPTSYQIKAWRSWSSAVATWSTWWYNTTNYCLQLADWWSNDVSSSNYVLRVFYTNQWWDRTSATHISFDSDWITLNFNYSWENIVMEITAY